LQKLGMSEELVSDANPKGTEKILYVKELLITNFRICYLLVVVPS
jgi:hypothetical protein